MVAFFKKTLICCARPELSAPFINERMTKIYYTKKWGLRLRKGEIILAKLTCGICGSQITISMSRFTTKDKEKICKNCGKNAGLTAFSTTQLTLKEIVETKKDTYSHNSDRITNQLREIGKFDTWGTKKEINELPKIIFENETIKFLTSGIYNGNTAIIVTTDQRIIFLDKGLLYGTTKSDMPIDKVDSVSFKKGLVQSTITILSASIQYKMNAIPNTDIDRLVDTINNCINESKDFSKKEVSGSSLSVADEILKFKELLDMGIITLEEFNLKKNELLRK
ncbi:MAG TPA: hypothetical protein GX525_07015 [Bacilli bacterium]|nr:hypothetical protein [Bacilli bacterium]